jgi:hypothetical protein
VGTLLLILKFALAVILLPVVIGTTCALQNELATFEPAIRQALFVGMVSYVLMKFFVYDFSPVYAFGQGLLTTVFQFLKPLVNAAPYVLPIYTFAIIIVYGVLSLMGKMQGEWQWMFLFLSAFTFTMHIVLTAQDLYNKDSIAGKPNYFFGMSLVYIVDVFLMALIMSLAVQGFSFPRFFQELTGVSGHIYGAIFRQLF